MAILRANDHCLPLAQIYQWISDRFPFYVLTESGWQNSVRHNLSAKEYFIKIERPLHDPGKDHYRAIKHGREHEFTTESDVDCSAKAVGSLQTGRDWIQSPAARSEQLVAPNTSHSVRALCSKNKTIEEEWITALECVSAAGAAIPSLNILKAQHTNTAWIPAHTSRD
jgi:hypothetical protein